MWHFEHKKTGWKLDIKDITQKDLENYFQQYREGRPEAVSATEQHGLAVRSAARAGWTDSIQAEQVDDMPPAKVCWLAEKINQVYSEATTIPPEE